MDLNSLKERIKEGRSALICSYFGC